MLKVVTSNEMREMDRRTIEDIGVPGVVLMENAGTGTFRVIQKMLEDLHHPLVYVFCGKGNNGGDGFVVARHLWDSGIAVEIFVIGDRSDVKGDARINFEISQKFKIPTHFISNPTNLQTIWHDYPDLVVDALLGTGIQGAVRGFMKEVITELNKFECPIVAVDLPSGMNADSPQVAGEVVEADATVTMALPKLCHVFQPAKSFVGELFIADIGIPHSIRHSDQVKVQMVEKRDIRMPQRPEDAHKYSCGKVAVLAGSPGYTGAAALASEAALHIGAGLVILAIPEILNPILEIKLTEVITRPYATNNAGYLSPEGLKQVEELFDWCDVLAIGPGLGRNVETQEAVVRLLKEFSKPAVIDADALFALARKAKELFDRPRPNWILTPHHGEFLRFLPGFSKEGLKEQVVAIPGKFAREFQLNLLLKGAPSVVAAPDGNIFVNPTGNSGLASGGSGDVLTGMVAGLLAQGLAPVNAAYTANYLHGLCADEVVKTGSKYSLVAGDLIIHLGRVLNQFLVD